MAHPKGGYRLADGTRVPGVTTILGRFKDSGGLLWWAFEQGKAAERGEIDSLYDKRDSAADAGTLAHDMLEDYVCGGDGQAPLKDCEASEEVIAQAKKGFDNAAEWFRDTKITVTDTEMPLVSEKYRFGGCPDAIGKDGSGRPILCDWKTSSGIYVDYLIQLAAYCELLRECHDFDPVAVHCVRFSKEHADFEHRKFEDIGEAWEQFQLFLRAYEIDKRLKKRIR